MDPENRWMKKKFNRRAHLNQKFKTKYGSQQEGHGRALLQKKAVRRQYFRQQKREEEKNRKKNQHQLTRGDVESKDLELQCNDVTQSNEENDAEGSVFSQKFRKKKLYSWQRAKAEYRKKISEKEQKKEDSLKRRKEIEEAKRKYQEKRLQRYKKLNQKTKKGQPVMSGRIELMLEQLQKEMNSS